MRILVLQHVDVEHPGIFREFWREAQIRWDAVEVDAGEPIPDLSLYDAMIVMGGPMDVWQEAAYPWLVPEKRAIREFVLGLKRPFLGICLGHQLLADAAGGEVGLSQSPEVGITPVTLTPAGLADGLLAGVQTPLATFQWHGAEIKRLPPGAVVLAENDACAVQGVRVGDHAYGLQFHIELTDVTVREWKAIPAYAASLRTALGDRADGLEADTLQMLPAFNAAARRVNENFMAIVARNLGREAQ